MKVDGAISDDKATTVDNKVVRIVAGPDTKLTRTAAGIILDIKGNQADVSVYGLEITGGTGTSAAVSLSGGTGKLLLASVTVDGNQGPGVAATSGTLTVTRSTIARNSGGGISISNADFDITNNFIISNGGASTNYGGMSISQISLGKRRLEFNTITNNSSDMNTASGVGCNNIVQLVAFSNNIVFDNQIGNNRTQVGTCNWIFSDIGDSISGNRNVLPGVGNINVDPSFSNVTANNYHLNLNSMARNAGDNIATLDVAVDFDGDSRPQEDRSDMGADEIIPR